MSTPDYDQFSEDHQCLLIVVKPIGPQMNQNLFHSIYEKLVQFNELKITNSKIIDFERTIHVRYKKSYSIEDNDWGDFQAHRKLVGLITVARSFNKNEIESISELHKTIHDTYNNTLFDSKCFILKSNNLQQESISCQPEHQSQTGPNSNEIVFNNVDDDVPMQNDKYPCDSEADPMFDCDIGGQLYISSDHTCFTSRVNRSSSSSSLSSQNSQSTTSINKSSNRNIEESLNYSLPPLTSDDNGLKLNHSKPRTHSRNKSLDSKFLSSNNESVTNLKVSTQDGYLTHSSSTSLSTSQISPNNCDSTQQISSSANEFIDYESDEQCCEQIQLKTKEFLTGLFWTLESRRLDKTREKKEKIPLLMAPCEKKDLVGLDTDTRSFRRKCLGRMQKHIADLSLMVGLPQEAFLNYLAAIEHLKSVSDKLWLASAYEGLCSASLVLLYPKRCQHIQELRKRFSYPNGIVHDLLNRNDYENARTEVGKFMKKIALEDSRLDSQIVTNKTLMKSILTVDQFYEKYKEAASNYALYRGAAVLEFECSFKAAKTLTFFRRYLKASDFIQNAVFISLNQSIDDQIERLLRISNLYEIIGFYRKAAFFKRFSALKTVSTAGRLDWEKCYFLLLPALYGYGLTLDPQEYDDRLSKGEVNWSAIHVQLLQEIITTSLKMQNETLAIRHISFMLQCLFPHITPSQRQEFATKLSSLASKCGEGSPVTLKLNNGATIPSVNFTKFPTVVHFKIDPLKPYLKLYKLRSKSSMNNDDENDQKYSGPFIYTPIQMNRPEQENQVNNPESGKKMNFFWAQGNIGCASLSLHNYLPIELNITSIIMMTDGVAFEPKHDTSLKIAPNSTCKNISLTGIPRSSGTLDILGYKIHTLGIKSDCRLKQLPNARKLKLPAKFSVEVAPRMPLMCAQCLAEDLNEELCLTKNISSYKDRFADSYICNSNFISLFEGQRKSYQIKLTNISNNNDEFIDLINVQVKYPKGASLELRNLINIKWDDETFNDLLPFGPNLSIQFEITMSAKGDFILLKNATVQNEKNKLVANTPAAKNSNGIPPSKKLQVLGSKKLANFINELQSRKSSNDLLSMNNNSGNTKQQQQQQQEIGDETDMLEEVSQSKLVELCLQFEYSGGPGFKAGFGRRTSIYFAIEIKPSILITHWDVIQAEQMNECYLVFDTLNATDQEINLIYSANKEMLIEPKEKCRIPVPIKRCPLSMNDVDQGIEADQLKNSVDQYCSPSFNDDDHVGEHVRFGTKSTLKSSKSIDFLSHIFPTERKLEAILSRCRLHLLKQIDLRWTMPNTEIDGRVSVEKVPYSKKLLKSLLIPPIQSEIQLNSDTFRSSFGEINTKLGNHLSLQIRLFNGSEATLQFLRLYMIYYQDFQNMDLTKKFNHKIGEKILVSGCDSLCIKELQTKETYTHQCGLIFLYTGVYKLEICCLPEERFQQLIIENGSSLIDLHFNTQHSLFKCLQAMEITVEE